MPQTAKEDYVTEFLRERFPNGVDQYGEEIADEDLGADEQSLTVTDKTATITVANRKRFDVRATIFARLPPNAKRKWKAVATKRISGGSKELFSMPPGEYRVRIIKVMRNQSFRVGAGQDVVVRIG